MQSTQAGRGRPPQGEVRPQTQSVETLAPFRERPRSPGRDYRSSSSWQMIADRTRAPHRSMGSILSFTARRAVLLSQECLAASSASSTRRRSSSNAAISGLDGVQLADASLMKGLALPLPLPLAPAYPQFKTII
eukprot:scaffold626_cov137-Pinguiococcus_pyrenoidosus.AAC.4